MIESNLIVSVFAEYDVNIEIINSVKGPTTDTVFIKPAAGQKITPILALEDDISLRLGISNLIIGQNEKGLYVQWPKKDKMIVPYQLSIDSKLSINLGIDTFGQAVIFDLAKAPHLLVAGSTGQGKSVGLNVIASSLHAKNIELILIDPKRVEFIEYKNKPKCKVITDLTKAETELQGLVYEMEKRYQLLESAECRNLDQYEAKWNNSDLDPVLGYTELKPIVCIIDEFADLVMQFGTVSDLIVRIAQLARAVGIHLVIATQRPSSDVITGLIKANFSARLAYRTGSNTDSRIILDQSGAEKLVGMGDAILKNGIDSIRFQTSFIK